MSATFMESSSSSERPQQAAPSGAPADSTTDLHDERTSDLAPATLDIEPPATTDTSSVGEPLEAPPAPRERAPKALAPLGRRAIAAAELPVTPKHVPRSERRPPDTLAPGAVLCDRYLLEQVVGRGGTAVVYQARDMASGTGTARNLRIAIKAPREQAEPARAAARLRHEFEHASRLAHPNIVRVLELHSHGSTPFMTMELLQGRLLSSLIRDWTMLPPPLAYKILRGCAHALAHAHSRNIVHGDFKPGNVFVTPDEEVKVVDFGAATATAGGADSRIPAGTPAYASPDVLQGARPDRRDDIFSFACVAYELLTGQHPFEHKSSLDAQAQGKIPPRAWSLTAKQWLALLPALSWEREQRPTDIDRLLDALISESEHGAQPAPIQPLPTAVTADLPQDIMPQRRGWGFFAFVACALLVTFLAIRRQDESPQQADAAAVEVQTAAALPALPAGAAMGRAEASGHMGTPLTAASLAPPMQAPPVSAPAVQQAVAAPRRAQSAGATSEISFESRAIITSESSVAAVFVIKRSQPLRGRIRVQWNALSGSADAGIDFASEAAGSVEFADGQAQRAIYVPLRNDLIAEEDETFTVRLHSPQQARLGALARAEATIRDDD